MNKENNKKKRVRIDIYIEEEIALLINELTKNHTNQSRAITELMIFYYSKNKKMFINKHNPVNTLKKRVDKYNKFRKSESFESAKMYYRENKVFVELINYTYLLLKIYKMNAQKPILNNIKLMTGYFVTKEVKYKVNEFKIFIQNNFNELYRQFLESKHLNDFYVKQHGMFTNFHERIEYNHKKIEYKNEKNKKNIDESPNSGQ
jgi:hypothetical protein